MKTPDYVGIAREAAAEQRRATMRAVPALADPNTPGGAHWQEHPARPMGHLSIADQTLVILSFVEAGYILVLEAEDGTRYRCHADGAELPPGIADLPRAELPPKTGIETTSPAERK